MNKTAAVILSNKIVSPNIAKKSSLLSLASASIFPKGKNHTYRKFSKTGNIRIKVEMANNSSTFEKNAGKSKKNYQ
jgi:hypothetical protein